LRAFFLARIKVEIQILAELSRFEVAVFLKNPLHSDLLKFLLYFCDFFTVRKISSRPFQGH